MSESQTAGKRLACGPEIVGALASERGIAEAMQFLQCVPETLSDDTQKLTEGLADIIGWPEIAERSMAMNSGPRRTQWIQRPISGLISSSEYDAAQWIVDRLPTGAERESVVRTMATSLFREDREANVSCGSFSTEERHLNSFAYCGAVAGVDSLATAFAPMLSCSVRCAVLGVARKVSPNAGERFSRKR